MLSIRLLCSLPTTVCAAADSVIDHVALLPSNDSLRYSEQYLLYVRLLCSLLTLIVCTVVSQVTLLPSYNSKATGNKQSELTVPIYLNFWVQTRLCDKKLLGQFWVSSHHSHMRRSIHTRQGFYPGLRPGLWSLCWSQSTMLLSYNSLWSSR